MASAASAVELRARQEITADSLNSESAVGNLPEPLNNNNSASEAVSDSSASGIEDDSGGSQARSARQFETVSALGIDLNDPSQSRKAVDIII